jgi:hypothetical protein
MRGPYIGQGVHGINGRDSRPLYLQLQFISRFLSRIQRKGGNLFGYDLGISLLQFAADIGLGPGRSGSAAAGEHRQVSQRHIGTARYVGVNPGLRQVGTQVKLGWGSGYVEFGCAWKMG